MKTTSNTIMSAIGFVLAGMFLVSGCSKSTDADTNTSSLLTRSMTELDERIGRHDQIMSSDSTAEGRREEMQHYIDDLDHIMDDLGNMLVDMEDCHMTMGGHMMGSGDADAVCPSFDRMDKLHEEYHRHHDVMEDILHDGDHRTFNGEMDEHFAHMHSYMDAMMDYLDDEHGTEMMHDHGDDDHGHGGW